MNEQEYLEQYQKETYEKPSITTDVLTLAIDDKQEVYKLQVLLIKRKEHPFKGNWALPGSFMQIHESLEEAANRVIEKKTGLENSYIEQLYTFSDVERDPRMRILSTTYLNVINKADTTINKDCAWFDLTFTKTSSTDEESDHVDVFEITASNKNERLKAICEVITTIHPNRLEKSKQNIRIIQSDFAFDHAKMICLGYMRVVNKLNYTNIAFHFMNEYFSLPSLQKVYECLMQKELYKTSFRKQIKHMVQETDLKETPDGFSRPAKLYKYKAQNWFEL